MHDLRASGRTARPLPVRDRRRGLGSPGRCRGGRHAHSAPLHERRPRSPAPPCGHLLHPDAGRRPRDNAIQPAPSAGGDAIPPCIRRRSPPPRDSQLPQPDSSRPRCRYLLVESRSNGRHLSRDDRAVVPPPPPARRSPGEAAPECAGRSPLVAPRPWHVPPRPPQSRGRGGGQLRGHVMAKGRGTGGKRAARTVGAWAGCAEDGARICWAVVDGSAETGVFRRRAGRSPSADAPWGRGCRSGCRARRRIGSTRWRHRGRWTCPWSVAGAHLAAIFVVGRVPDIEQLVLDVPVSTRQEEQALRGRLLARQAGDAVCPS